ncbi:hypothetical protein Tco_0186502 [Tanacetum coccineum]
MTATKALIAIQEMADHSQKWHDKGSIRSLGGSSSDRISVIINKLSDIGRDMRKLKESVHAIQENVMKTGESNKTPRSTLVLGTFAKNVKRRIAKEREKTFLNILERVPVNTPLFDALKQTPDYTKSLQELVSKETRIKEVSMVKLNA